MIAAAPLPTLTFGPVAGVVGFLAMMAWIVVTGLVCDRWRARKGGG